MEHPCLLDLSICFIEEGLMSAPTWKKMGYEIPEYGIEKSSLWEEELEVTVAQHTNGYQTLITMVPIKIYGSKLKKRLEKLSMNMRTRTCSGLLKSYCNHYTGSYWEMCSSQLQASKRIWLPINSVPLGADWIGKNWYKQWRRLAAHEKRGETR